AVQTARNVFPEEDKSYYESEFTLTRIRELEANILQALEEEGFAREGRVLPSEQEREEAGNFLRQMYEFSAPAALFVAGALYQWLRNNGELGRWVLEAVSLGVSTTTEDLEEVEKSLPQSGPFERGRTAGDLAGIVSGFFEIVGGVGSIKGGGILCISGIGCIAGAPAIAAGAGLTAHGGSVVVESTGNIAEDMAELISQVFAIGGAGGRSRRAPELPSGTLTESQFLNAIEEFLGSGYREVSPGRYLSSDGMRQVRFGAHETRGSRLHGHFEAYDRPGGRVIENSVVNIIPDP
ncbi:MAG: hypothetical protein SW833_28745, partial [Cyanobacteriota bacterium]|nr:hypothetical protein [Cyanobacteriota bacterium]